MYFKYFNSWWIPSDVDIIDLEKYEKQPIYKPTRKWHGLKKEIALQTELSEIDERKTSNI